jgi:hypothetical protein
MSIMSRFEEKTGVFADAKFDLERFTKVPFEDGNGNGKRTLPACGGRHPAGRALMR